MGSVEDVPSQSYFRGDVSEKSAWTLIIAQNSADNNPHAEPEIKEVIWRALLAVAVLATQDYLINV